MRDDRDSPDRAGAARPADVPRWKREERRRLRALRETLGVAELAGVGAAIGTGVREVLGARVGAARGLVVAGYWPIRREPDLRPMMAALHAEGAVLALPVVETVAAPLVFRRWSPGAPMVRGHWDIPVPAPGAEALRPDVVLAPCIGWDPACFRLGYGGGYFDRTLAATGAEARARPFAVGVGLAAAGLATIHPEPHDVPLDAIVTEAGVAAIRRRAP